MASGLPLDPGRNPNGPRRVVRLAGLGEAAGEASVPEDTAEALVSVPTRALAVTLALCGTLVAGVAYGGERAARYAGAYIVVPSPSPTTPAEQHKLARQRFVVNAGLAAGATRQWIVKPWKAGAFKKGARGRKAALDKSGRAGAF